MVTVFSQPNPATRAVMLAKLRYAQGVLEGITLGNFELIATNAVNLRNLSGAGEWPHRHTKEYQMFAQDYRRHCQSLGRAAKDQKLDAAAVAYFQLTMSCLNCHSYLRDSRVAALFPSDSPLIRFSTTNAHEQTRIQFAISP